jgi:hypothetical protein
MSYEYDNIIYQIAIKDGFNSNAAKLIVAQARFESADYTSNVFKNNLNTSGMKYIGQPLATRGTLAPYNERSDSCKRGGTCANSDHYAKFKSVEDSAKDKIERNYNKTIFGVPPLELKKATTAEEFANVLKQRRYYGFHDFSTPAGKQEAQNYANGLKAKLLRINIQELYTENKGKFWTILGVGLVAFAFYLYTNKKALNKLSSKL